MVKPGDVVFRFTDLQKGLLSGRDDREDGDLTQRMLLQAQLFRERGSYACVVCAADVRSSHVSKHHRTAVGSNRRPLTTRSRRLLGSTLRKVSGLRDPVGAPQGAFEAAVTEVTATTARLLEQLPDRRQPPQDRPVAAPPRGARPHRRPRGRRLDLKG